jgi:hypothetical protein
MGEKMSDSAQSELIQAEFIGEGNENRITEIVVYSNQAYVKRQAQAKVRTGLNRMLIETRAFKIDTESVRARVYGEGEILSVQYNEHPIKDFAQDDIQQLVSKKKQLEHQRTALKNKNAVGEKQQRFLDSIIGFAETDMPRKIKTQFPTTENLQTMLEEKKAGEDFLINLGVERGVKIRREKITDKLTETFFGKVDRSSVARVMEYRIVMENLKDEVVRVRLMDCIPVSKTDRIQIKDVEATPKPAVNDYQEQEGVMLWDIDLKPTAVYDIRIRFFVKHPKNNPPWDL